MIFSQKLYNESIAELILTGKKTCTRRLVKEGEDWLEYTKETPKVERIVGVTCKPNFKKHTLNTKWQVGRSYSIQMGRGKPGLWYCPKCGKTKENNFLCDCGRFPIDTPYAGKEFRIKITGIRKERLLDISEESIKKEGFETLGGFKEAFFNINEREINKFSKENNLYTGIGGVCPNPEVWVLSFKVSK